MIKINGSRFFEGVQALSSLANTQFIKTSSFLSKLLTVENSATHLNKSQHILKDVKIPTEITGKRVAPPRPTQPNQVLKMKMFRADLKQDREMAREKWGLDKGRPDAQTGQTGNRVAPPRPTQPELALKLKMSMADWERDPEMAKEKWGLSK